MVAIAGIVDGETLAADCAAATKGMPESDARRITLTVAGFAFRRFDAHSLKNRNDFSSLQVVCNGRPLANLVKRGTDIY